MNEFENKTHNESTLILSHLQLFKLAIDNLKKITEKYHRIAEEYGYDYIYQYTQYMEKYRQHHKLYVFQENIYQNLLKLSTELHDVVAELNNYLNFIQFSQPQQMRNFKVYEHKQCTIITCIFHKNDKSISIKTDSNIINSEKSFELKNSHILDSISVYITDSVIEMFDVDFETLLILLEKCEKLN